MAISFDKDNIHTRHWNCAHCKKIPERQTHRQHRSPLNFLLFNSEANSYRFVSSTLKYLSIDDLYLTSAGQQQQLCNESKVQVIGWPSWWYWLRAAAPVRVSPVSDSKLFDRICSRGCWLVYRHKFHKTKEMQLPWIVKIHCISRKLDWSFSMVRSKNLWLSFFGYRICVDHFVGVFLILSQLWIHSLFCTWLKEWKRRHTIVIKALHQRVACFVPRMLFCQPILQCLHFTQPTCAGPLEIWSMNSNIVFLVDKKKLYSLYYSPSCEKALLSAITM